MSYSALILGRIDTNLIFKLLHKEKFGKFQYWLLQVSTFGKFPKMPNKMLKYWQILWPLSKFHLFPSLGTATHIIWLQFGKFLLFPPYVWLIGSKSSGIFRNFIIFIIKSAVDHASHIILCLMYGQTQKLLLFPHWFGSLAVNAREISKISLNSHQKSAVCFTWSNQVYKI